MEAKMNETEKLMNDIALIEKIQKMMGTFVRNKHFEQRQICGVGLIDGEILIETQYRGGLPEHKSHTIKEFCEEFRINDPNTSSYKKIDLFGGEQ